MGGGFGVVRRFGVRDVGFGVYLAGCMVICWKLKVWFWGVQSAAFEIRETSSDFASTGGSTGNLSKRASRLLAYHKGAQAKG